MRGKKITRNLLCLSSEASLRNLPADISVAPGLLEVRSGAACGAAALPPGVSLAPSSCRGLRRLPGDGLHLRLGTTTTAYLTWLRIEGCCLFFFKHPYILCCVLGSTIIRQRHSLVELLLHKRSIEF
uniref:Uncharacterized protein n=1 Tax=Pavo cristatus TaxID=9049 RepID=A0A8C9FDE9_PAVCR